MLAVVVTSWRCSVIGFATLSRILSATDLASRRPPSVSSTITNSSPPIRATVSLLRTGATSLSRDRPQDDVAELVPVLVVGLLEVVDIEEEHGEDRTAPRRVGEGLHHPVHQEIPVRQLGQLIVRGQVLQIELGPLEFVDLARDPHEADDVARSVAERHLRRGRPVQLRTLHPAALDHADDGLARLHDPEVFHERPPTERLAEQIDVGLAHELGRIGEAEAGGHPLADAEQAALTILEVDAVLRVLQERTELGLLARRIELSHHRPCLHRWRRSMVSIG